MTRPGPRFTPADAALRAAERAAGAAGDLEGLPDGHERTKRELRDVATELRAVATLLASRATAA